MKTLRIFFGVAAILVVLALLYLGVRLVPGALTFALARDLAVDAGCDRYAALAVALIAGAISAAALWWRGFSWRKAGVLTLVVPFALAAYFAGKSFLRNRLGDVSNPDAVRWFGNDGRALLYYARQPDGVLIFADRPGFHYRTGHQLQGVTAEIYQEWRQLKEQQAAQIEESAALKEKLASQTIEAERTKQELEAQIQTSNDKLRQEREERAKSDNELQKHLREAGNETAQVRGGLEKAKHELEERVAHLTLQAAQTRQRLETQIPTSEDKLRQEREERAKSEKELQKRIEAARQLKCQSGGKGDEAERQPQGAGTVGSPLTQPATPTAPTPSAPVTIQIRNATGHTVYLNFSSARHNHVWPSPGQAWIVVSGQTFTIRLSGGFPGEQVFYSAWAAENPNIQWGKATWMREDQLLPVATCGAGDPPLFELVYPR